MTKLIRKIKCKLRKKKGFSIVEVLVAIAISAIALTSAATFSARLMVRGQMNFLDQSALQLQALVTEQVRFLELSMQNTLLENGGEYPDAGLSNPIVIKDDWQNKICAKNFNSVTPYTITNFSFDSSQSNSFTLEDGSGRGISNSGGEYHNSARFISIGSYTDGRIGILEIGTGANPINNMWIAITSIFEGSSADLDKAKINFEIGVRYSTLNENVSYDFTKPIIIQMNYADVCVV